MNRGFYGIPKNRTYQPSIYPYKVYTALLTQTSTNPPVAIVLENTIGNIWFTYDHVGVYRVHSAGLFTNNKTTVSIDTFGNNGDFTRLISYRYVDINRLGIYTDRGGFSNDILINNRLEIRVYN
jgi:hypothetical protein